MWPLKTQNGISHAFCGNLFGEIHQNEKSLSSKETFDRNYNQSQNNWVKIIMIYIKL